MIEFQGTYFDGASSRAQPVEVFFDGMVLRIRRGDWSSEISVPLSRCIIDPPLGRTRRSVRLPSGGLLETEDHAAVESLERYTGKNRMARTVHFLESRWKLVAGCLAGLAVCVVLFAVYAIPYLAERVAATIPARAMEKLTVETLKVLDNRLLEPTRIAPADGDRIKSIFQRIVGESGSGFNDRMELRKGKALGANALALPDGLILVTDELVALSNDEKELVGVLAHEIAHVRKRHAVRSILQNSAVFLLISALAGDVVSISSLAASLPMVLLHNGYSRGFEKEADREAGLYLIRKGWGTGPYQKMLLKLEKSRPEPGVPGLLSTHPPIAERIRFLKDLETSAGTRKKTGQGS